MSLSRSSSTCIAGLLVTTALIISYARQLRRVRLPPGPPGWPIVGNVFDLPPQGQPIPWQEHKDAFGPISSVTILGQTVVLLNDLQTIEDLLDKRSLIYSGRPIFPFAGSLVGWDHQLIMAQYDNHFYTMRKMLKSYLGSQSAVSKFRNIQELETRYFLARILDDPGKLIYHIRLTAGAISLLISHGYTVETDKPDPLVDLIESAAKEFYIATRPGAWLVDLFPIMKYLPGWLPFQRTAALYRHNNMEQTNRPHEFVKSRMRAGAELPSFTSDMMHTGPDEVTEHSVKFAATAIYGGGSDPAVASLSTFILLMILHPEVQRRAREELDSVVGTKRLPNFDDRPRMPYIEAILKEVMRWHAVARIGIPHRAIQDDTYNGYLIPKGSIILPHIWNITRDPQFYSKPEEFCPERFLAENGHTPELDVNRYIFGFGRRACPGNDLANANMFIAIAMILSVFDLSRGRDENGEEIEPRCEFEGGTVSHPLPFTYTLKLRSVEAEHLIRAGIDEAPLGLGDGSYLLCLSQTQCD